MIDNAINIGIPPTKEDREQLSSQYKVIIDSISQLNTIRELSNPFWLTANGITISGISYVNTVEEVAAVNKVALLISLFLVGYLFCLAWITFLNNIRRSLAIRYELLLEVEKYLPVKFIQRVYGDLNKREGKWTLTVSELSVPSIFLVAYTLLLSQLIFKHFIIA
ncbi:RipA family octameric membrane protein [Candidatus Odyssella thessalonicensis]|uniref:RipA family octameric membrane protein n=1 Tax=Candidatus Odyssella thessalonicensis TaxID=84647 RepID=UPI000225B6E3|nr:hypothetical protein [Candidatus Odyssella thessalonicensis]